MSALLRKAAVIPVLIFLISCGKDGNPFTRDSDLVSFDYDNFKKKRSGWEELGIHSYSYTYTFRGFGCWSVRNTVKSDTVYSSVPDSLECPLHGHGDPCTIDEVFQMIEDRYEDPYLDKVSFNTYFYCSEIKIEYDSLYFFPKEFEFVYEGKNMEVTDTENMQVLKDFEPE